MIGRMKYFLSLTAYQGESAASGICKKGEITGISKISKSFSQDIENMYCMNRLNYNLLSVSQIYDRANKVLFDSTQCLITNVRSGEIILKGKRYHNVYISSIMYLLDNEVTCLVCLMMILYCGIDD